LKIYNATFVTMKAVASMKYRLLPPGIDVIAGVVKPSRVWRRVMMLCAVETRMCKIHEA